MGILSMRTFRTIAMATAVSGPLLTAAYSFAAPAADQGNAKPDEASASGDQSTPYNGNPLSGDQLSHEYQNLSPATRAALANQLKSKGVDGLTNMSESDARTAFAGLPPDVKAQIQAKWDALSDEQRIALKKMGPAAVKELVASQMKEVMKQSMSPVVKPVQQVVEKAQSAAQSAKTMMQKGRDYVQGLIAKFKGQASQPTGQGQ
jgi:hypothetical protein